MDNRKKFDEKAILNKVADGDEDAFRQLVYHYSNHLAGYLNKFTRSRFKTEEIMQDVFLQIWLTRDALSKVSKFPNFLFLIAKNHALNSLRSLLREQKRMNKWQMENMNESESPLSEGFNPDMTVIEQAIRQVPSQQKKVWLASRRDGKKYHQIAQEMNLSRETVKKYIQFANASILRFLQKHMEFILAGIIYFLVR